MYIDPNTGGVLFQALAASLAAISGLLLIFSRQIRTGIAKLRRRGRKDETMEEVETKVEETKVDETKK
jgi:hypothetical protein